jgi:hypothetical protein
MYFMLENLINLIKQQAGTEIENNPAIPVDKKQPAIRETEASITNGLQNLASGDGLKDLLKMFREGGDAGSSPVAQSLSGDTMNNLTNKVGLDQQTAGGIAGLIPGILNSLVKKTNDPNDSGFDLQSIINQLTGGKTGGINLQEMIGKFTKGGLDKDADGDVDLQDVMKMFRK